MAHGIVKLADNEYVEWSTVVDSPVASIWWREAMLFFGHDASDLDEADRRGHTFDPIDGATAADYVSWNRAGPNEKSISLDAIRKRYKPRKRDFDDLMRMCPPGSAPRKPRLDQTNLKEAIAQAKQQLAMPGCPECGVNTAAVGIHSPFCSQRT